MLKKIMGVIALSAALGTISFASVAVKSEIAAANSLAEQGIINNHINDPQNYNLDDNVLRQEIAAVARGIAKLEKKDKCGNVFSDLSATNPNSWACINVEVLVDNDLISTNTNFRPEDKITKSEAIAMIVKAIGFDYNYDISSSKNWQQQVVEYVVNMGIVDSFTDYNTHATRGWIFEVAEKANNNDNNENELNDFIITTYSEFGRDTGYNVHDDGKYKYIDQFTTLYSPGEDTIPQCYEGNFSEDSFKELKKYIIDSGFFEDKITQEEDGMSLICEGGSSFNIKIGNKSNRIEQPCVGQENENTKNILSNLTSIYEKIGNIEKEDEIICKIGQYIQLDVLLCNYTPEEIINSNYRDLSYILKQSYDNLGAYNYISDNDSNDNYNRKYYKIENKCYFSQIYNFDGIIFE